MRFHERELDYVIRSFFSVLICGVSCPYETRFLTATIAAFRYRLIVQHPFPWTRAAKASFLVFGKAGHLMQICVEFLVAASVTATPCNNSSSYRRANIRTVTIDETVIFSQTQFLSPSALVISTGNFYFFFFFARPSDTFILLCMWQSYGPIYRPYNII